VTTGISSSIAVGAVAHLHTLPRALSTLRTAAQHHRGCLGVYACVRSSGRVAVGDQVRLTPAAA
jgi:hypothetical protein